MLRRFWKSPWTWLLVAWANTAMSATDLQQDPYDDFAWFFLAMSLLLILMSAWKLRKGDEFF